VCSGFNTRAQGHLLLAWTFQNKDVGITFEHFIHQCTLCSKFKKLTTDSFIRSSKCSWPCGVTSLGYNHHEQQQEVWQGNKNFKKRTT
jgi:hypothetical protein